MGTTSLPVEGPLDLRAVLRPLHGRFAADGWWLAARTPAGPGSLRITRDRSGLIGSAWGEGSGWLLDRLGQIAGLDDDPAAFAPADPIVASLHRSAQGMRFGRTGLVFDSLLRAIAAQKVTGREAKAAMTGLYRVFTDPAPGPNQGLRLPPDPERMAETPYWVFHELHLEKRRADLIRRVSADRARIDLLATVGPGQASAALRAYAGIGEWTIASTIAVSHGDPDQVPVGDYHIKHIVTYHLTGRPRGTDEEMLELLVPFRPHRGRVIRLLHTLGPEPKFGPRSTPRDITRI